MGFGLPTRQDTSKAHGEPPGNEELDGAKDKLGWPKEPRFYIPEDVLASLPSTQWKWQEWEVEWRTRMDAYQAVLPTKSAELERRLRESCRRLATDHSSLPGG